MIVFKTNEAAQMLLSLSHPLQPISNLSKIEARKCKHVSLKLALQRGKKLPKASPSRTNTKRSIILAVVKYLRLLCQRRNRKPRKPPILKK